MLKPTVKVVFLIRLFIHCANLGFFGYLIGQIFTGAFGADPVEAITHFTGIAALNLLVVTLCITPLCRWLKQGMFYSCRRMLGLYSFFWASLHMLTFFWLNLALNFALIGSEVIQRPYLTLGAICWLILLMLAVTSTNAMQRKMGKYWQKCHNWVYLVLLLAPIHFYWSAKSELIEPSLYIVIALFLLYTRRSKLVKRLKFKRSSSLQ